MASKKVTKQTSEHKKKEATTLLSITDLIHDSWKLFERTADGFIKLFLLTVGCLFAGLLIGSFVVIPLSFNAFGSRFSAILHPTGFTPLLLLLLLIWAILYMVLVIILGITFPIVSIFILQEKKKESIFELIKQSRAYFLPYFITFLLSVVITFGGVLLFVIPGLIIGLFFTFVVYEVVLDGQVGRVALQRSYVLVKNHFWEVLIRLLLLEIGIIIISSILANLARGNWLLQLVKFLFTVFSMWYSRAYVYSLYKQVREHTTFPQKISIQWMWVISGIGWLFVVGAIIALFTGMIHLPGPVPILYHYKLPSDTV